MAGDSYNVQSVKDACQILKEIAYIGEPVGTRELARATNLNSNKGFPFAQNHAV